MTTPKVVVMGGGTGTFSVISALKQMEVNITTVIAVSDSGGSTGRIRDEFGFQPVGDLRQSLAALAENQDENWIQNILLYRFDKGTGLKGHNLGNLILTALQDMTGSTADALRIAGKVFKLQGRVLPVTDENVNLKIFYEDGSFEIGEHILDENPEVPKKIEKVSLEPNCSLSSDAKEALLNANYIIVGPGDYYASLMATLVLKDIPEVFSKTNAKIIYITNLMTRKTQTQGMTVKDHVNGIEAVLRRSFDHILINSGEINPESLEHYAGEGEFPVVNDLIKDSRAIILPLASSKTVNKKESDIAHRSLIRHDPILIKDALVTVIV